MVGDAEGCRLVGILQILQGDLDHSENLRQRVAASGVSPSTVKNIVCVPRKARELLSRGCDIEDVLWVLLFPLDKPWKVVRERPHHAHAVVDDLPRLCAAGRTNPWPKRPRVL